MMKVAPLRKDTSNSTKSTSTERQRKQVSKLQEEELKEHQESVKHASTFDITLLGIAIVIGGQVFSWNFSLAAGFWEGFLGLMLTALGYLFLIFCISEMNSALPFSGGSYGFVRVCIGPFFGYVIGCCEALQNMAYVAAAVIPFGQMLTIALNTPVSYEPIWWTIFYLSAITLNIIGGSVFWKFNSTIGLISLLLIVIYILGTSQYGNFDEYSGAVETDDTLNNDPRKTIYDYSFDGKGFITLFPICSWYFIGVESLPLVSVDCEQPHWQLPIGMVSCMLILLATAIGVFFTATCQSPGTADISGVLLPLNSGYQRLFGLSDADVTWLAIPGTYATGLGFMFVYGRQMSSMARSGLLPAIFKHRTTFSKTPYTALIFGSLLSLVALLSIYYTDLALIDDLFQICILSSTSVYICVFISYFIFRKRYEALPRSFYNPLGPMSAIIGIMVYTLDIISILGYQNSKQIPFIIYIIYLTILIVYYYCYGYHDQKLSEEEQKVLFRAYVINANAKKRGRRGPRSTTSNASHASKMSRASAGGRNLNRIESHGSMSVASASDSEDQGGESRRSDGTHQPDDGAISSHPWLLGKSGSVLPSSLVPKMAPLVEDKLREDSITANVAIAANLSVDPRNDESERADHRNHQADDEVPESPLKDENDDHSYRIEDPNIEVKGSDKSHHPHHFHHLHYNDENDHAGGDLLRKSFMQTKSISEKVKEFVQDLKFLPLMDNRSREEYEQVMLGDVLGKYPEELLMHEKDLSKVIPINSSAPITPTSYLIAHHHPSDEVNNNHHQQHHHREQQHGEETVLDQKIEEV